MFESYYNLTSPLWKEIKCKAELFAVCQVCTLGKFVEIKETRTNLCGCQAMEKYLILYTEICVKLAASLLYIYYEQDFLLLICTVIDLWVKA